jgi:hypothetical protein
VSSRRWHLHTCFAHWAPHSQPHFDNGPRTEEPRVGRLQYENVKIDKFILQKISVESQCELQSADGRSVRVTNSTEFTNGRSISKCSAWRARCTWIGVVDVRARIWYRKWSSVAGRIEYWHGGVRYGIRDIRDRVHVYPMEDCDIIGLFHMTLLRSSQLPTLVFLFSSQGYLFFSSQF